MQHTHCGGGGGVDVDYTPHIGPHRINGSVRRESILVDAQISGALLHHLADDVYFHLRMAGNQTGSLLFIDRRCLSIAAPCKHTRFCHQRREKHRDNKKGGGGHFQTRVRQSGAKYLLIRMTGCISADDLLNKHSSLL